MNITRRDLLKLGTGAAATCVAGALPRRAFAKPEKKIPIALQLYSVRQACEKDLPGVLKAVKEMGYEGVEFAGYYGRSAKQLRKLLDDHGLKCCGTHTGINTLLADAFDGTVEFNKILGNPFLICPGLPNQYRASADAWKKTAKLFDEMAEKAKAVDMYVGYHAHGGDFQKYDGRTGWDILFSSTRPDVVMQMDIGNCLGGGGDPIAVLKKFPGRSLTVHLKEHGGKPGAPVGEGDVNWDEVFRICESTGGTRWYIVEHESGSAPLQSVKACLENLRKMGK